MRVRVFNLKQSITFFQLTYRNGALNVDKNDFNAIIYVQFRFLFLLKHLT